MVTVTVTVFSKKDCPACHATTRKLEKCGLSYQLVSVDGNPALVEQLIEGGHRQMPIVFVGRRVWTGYRPDLIGRAAEDPGWVQAAQATEGNIHG